MTQVGEAIGIALIAPSQDQCPFSHDPPPVKKITNVLMGSGQTLANSMRTAKPTFKYDDAPGFMKDVSLPNPKDVPGHPFHKSDPEPVTITVKEQGGDKDYHYPVSCAAHHLVPAQEALKPSKLTEYMIKKGDTSVSAKVKTGKATSTKPGKCWSHVGYDVNGSQNGVFLPGAYAVNDGTWLPLHLIDKEKEVPGVPVMIGGKAKLTGGVSCEPGKSRKWDYVRVAVALASGAARRGYGGQFHDRHEPYSEGVAEALNVIHARLQLLERKYVGDEKCPDCKKRKDDIKKLGVPTPFGLVDRINKVSQKLEGKLTGSVWDPAIYTSEWGNAYMQFLKKK
jgi:hypothetical protein